MHLINSLRRGGALVAALAVTAALCAVASAPALATETTIYGSGAALQTQLQALLIPAFEAGHSGHITYTGTTSGKGFEEFGNTNGIFEWTDTSLTKPDLDAFVATDSSPTTTEQTNTQGTEAAGSTSTHEVVVPVAQTPIDILLSLPLKLTIGASQEVNLTNVLLSELFAGTVSANSPYEKDTWGALLKDAGVSSFTDEGNKTEKTGGYSQIVIELRKNGAGTTYNLKQYLDSLELSPNEWSTLVSSNSYEVSANWPSGLGANYLPSTVGNSTDIEEAEAVYKHPGTVGYATAGDAFQEEFASTSTTTKTAKGGKEQAILYAEAQDNGTATSGAKYANPEATEASAPIANVYHGAKINVNGSDTSYVGDWIVPESGGIFEPLGTWSPTRASDSNVYTHSGSKKYYPLVAVAYDLSWSNFDIGNLVNDYTSPATPTTAQATATAYLKFVTGNTGQNDILNSTTKYYAPLPSEGSTLANIQEDAEKAAAGV